MGNAGHPPYTNLDYALERGYLPAAWRAAHERSFVFLDQALLLVLLMAEDEGPGYVRAARRFLIRFIREAAPTLDQVKRVADALAILEEPENLARIEARGAMAELATQLKERRETER